MNISEETLGAYLEGNLSADEMSDMEQAICSSSELHSFVEDLQSLDIDWRQSINADMPDFESDFELPSFQDDSQIGNDLFIEMIPNEDPDIEIGDISDEDNCVADSSGNDLPTDVYDSSLGDFFSTEDGPIDFNNNIDDVDDFTSQKIGE